jgi:chromosome partitioning protein
MPTIPFVSPKGGVGKTTSALLLATLLAKIYDVTLIDADPNQPIADWASGGNVPPRLTIISDVNEETITERIQEAASKSTFVIVDLEGTASKIVLYAIAEADFVVIPTQGSHLDAKEASRAIRAVLRTEKLTRRRIPFAVSLTRTAPMIRTRGMTHIQNTLSEAGVPVLNTELNERDAFRAVFAFRQTLDSLDPTAVPNLDKAALNIAAFAHEVVSRLASEQLARGGTTSPPAVAGVAGRVLADLTSEVVTDVEGKVA